METSGLFENMDSDDYGILRAFVASFKSRDPNTKIGACIINNSNQVVGEGCNFMPPGCDNIGWINVKTDQYYKYKYVVFAVTAAIFNAVETSGCTLYVNMFPSKGCAKLIVMSGIRKVVYFPRTPTNKDIRDGRQYSERILENAGVELREHEGSPQFKKIIQELDDMMVANNLNN